jgi:hypothetical protein
VWEKVRGRYKNEGGCERKIGEEDDPNPSLASCMFLEAWKPFSMNTS